MLRDRSNAYPIIAHGPIKLLYCSFQMPSMTSGVETPSASTAMTSRLIAAQIRLKIKPDDSFRAVTGWRPASLCLASTKGKISGAV